MVLNKKKNVKEDFDKYEYIPCDFCNSTKFKTLFVSKDYVFNNIPGNFKIVKCLNCKLVYTNPRLKAEELNKHYSREVKYGEPSIHDGQILKTQSIYNSKYLTNFYNYPICKKRLIYKIIFYPYYLRKRRSQKRTQSLPTYIQNGKVLEIGCSYGHYLFQLKNLGWNVKGVELNKEAVDYAKFFLKLDVINMDIYSFHPDGLFDIIYLRMVLEHMESPKVILNKCYSWLKPTGKLVLIIPDFSGIEVKIYKKYAHSLHVPYHLYHFTPDSIKKYLESLGFKKIRFTHDNFDRTLLAPLNYILREYPNNLLAFYILKIATINFVRRSFVRILVNILALLGKTSTMTVNAIK